MNVAYLSLVISGIALLISIAAFLWYRKWYKYHYLAEVWYEIKKIALDHPNFKNGQKTKDYKNSFSGDERLKYEVFAELCWGYVEDLWVNGYAKKEFYIPTLKEFKRLHECWLRENRHDYSEEMIKFINQL